ncbi:baseplate wedge subunit [Klebsiella phage vB_Kpn_F48]|uniref:Baseplate wedge protein gp6 n=1 Tax=Klebsiella phage vB_Kpn_F48 TaxID=2070028 RepID=A0A2I6UFX6_9CAUD|nr:baseplate wedge subunit [Klebsiella phage vB_Kpn_F48]AUO78882.1 baseplate wedge subunit [Klebsiella phage vB_Kpn_F48]
MATTEPVNYQLTRTANAIPEAFVGATFDEIKNNLIDWLSSQSEFQDYDFSGSRINVLLDLLAYNTLYIQQFANTAIYESFIGTANLRSSVVQAAQENGYLPASKSAAKTSIMLDVTHDLNPVSLSIPRGTKFLAYARDTSADPYSFVTTKDVVVTRDDDKHYWPVVELAQGRIIRQIIQYDPKVPILVRDPNIDRSEVRLMVNGSEWTNRTDRSMVHTGSTSHIYYMRETVDGDTEFFFGEGVETTSVAGGVLEANFIGGLKPTRNDTITIEYIRTEGDVANGAVDFSYADTLQYVTVNKIIENWTNSPDYVGADGGGDPEGIERIRELATLKRESQMRCVSKSDYESFVSSRFGNIVQAVQCFTDQDKPGYAFIAIKPKSGLQLTAVQREDIKAYLEPFTLAPITPAIMSPDYLFIKQNVKVSYAMNKLQESEQWLENKILDQIDTYYRDEVEIFNSSFSKSKMLTYVDDANISILGSSATIQLVREVVNYFVLPESGIKYYNQINKRTLESSDISFVANSELSYPVRIYGADPDELGKGNIVIGPFRDGDIVENTHITPYTGSDFNKPTIEGRTKFYKVGEISYPGDNIYWNLGALGVTSDRFEDQSIELYSTPSQDIIFSRDGTLIVFENDLRPQYTTITLEPITQ